MSSLQPADCELFIGIPDEGIFPIVAIPADVLKRRFKQTNVGDTSFYSAHEEEWTLSLTYEEGQLRAFEGRPYSFGRTVQGQPLSFPIKYEELHAVWGIPDAIDSRRVTKRLVSP